MNRFSLIRLIPLFVFFTILMLPQTSSAAKNDSTEIVRVVIHVTHSNQQVYRAALNYSRSLLEHYGDKVKIAIVANGPGIGLLNKKNRYIKDIQSLIKKGVTVSACNTTVRIMRKFKELPIIEGVEFVATGVVKVIELQQQGYLYLHP